MKKSIILSFRTIININLNQIHVDRILLATDAVVCLMVKYQEPKFRMHPERGCMPALFTITWAQMSHVFRVSSPTSDSENFEMKQP